MDTRVINTLLSHIAGYKTKAAKATEEKAKLYKRYVEDFQAAVENLRVPEKTPPPSVNISGGQVSLDELLGSGNARALDDYLGTTVRCTNCVGSKEIFKDRDLIVTGYDCTVTKKGRVFTLLVGFPDTAFNCGTWIALDEVEVIKDIDETIAARNEKFQ